MVKEDNEKLDNSIDGAREQEPQVGEAAVEVSAQEIEALQSQVEDLRAQNEELLDKYRRSLADFANYRKRQDRERDQQRTRLLTDVLQRVLPVLDDFELAIRDIPQEADDSRWVEGVLLIERKLREMLREFKVEPIQALGESFDPNYHSALLNEESARYPAGTVMEELRKGYLMEDRVLRPTLVKVSAGWDEGAEDSCESDERDNCSADTSTENNAEWEES